MPARIPKLYMLVGVIFVTAVALFILFQAGIAVFVLGLLLALLTGAFIYFGHFLTPLITKAAGITYRKGEFTFPPGQDVVLKKSGDKYMAAKFLLVNIPEREEVIGKREERAEVYLKDFEAAVSAIHVPVKFNMLIATKDITAYRESIQSKVYEYGLRIKREMEKAEPDVIKLDKWQKEKEFNENLLKRLASGVKPMACVMYVMTLSKGITPKEAIDKAKANAKEIKAILSNNLNAEVIELAGEDAELCLEWERALPVSYDELVSATD
ncbi:MAG: hypothetical protein N3H30_02420 [Candidatus Micrarchaeota archaeon]|nr:hypothetical protein [Candidatus Micrarchaeota archaeon]